MTRKYCSEWLSGTCLAHLPCLFETDASHPFMRMRTMRDSIQCTCTDSRLNMSGLCVRASRCIFCQLSSAFIGEEKMPLLAGCITHNPCCRWVSLLCMGTTNNATQYSLRVWEPVVCRWAPACWSKIPRRCSFNLPKKWSLSTSP